MSQVIQTAVGGGRPARGRGRCALAGALEETPRLPPARAACRPRRRRARPIHASSSHQLSRGVVQVAGGQEEHGRQPGGQQDRERDVVGVAVAVVERDEHPRARGARSAGRDVVETDHVAPRGRGASTWTLERPPRSR
jgi:hypothetical protein